ncbi:MAG: hypothetical protein GX552_03580 [Chloroflexi bacterium]|nr:hypothetical protein [Chloroflexota bacterium]
MLKFLFLDYRNVETLSGFTRRLEQPTKHPDNPLFVADAPWEYGNMQLYGSVLKAPGRPFQMWYSCIHPPFDLRLAYAESKDGLHWRRPLFDFFRHQGERTNILLANNPHGPAVIYDAADPREDWRYKLVAGTDPSGCISAFHSADGIHWQPVKRHPILTTDPDCPMGFLRAPDGRYVIYHRVSGYGRRVFRSESWDFVHWSGEPRMVLEPDAGDPPQVQFYGMGATAYGDLELGTLWIYHTDADDTDRHKAKGYQDAELTYARSGYAWHRAAQGTPFIPHGGPEDWDCGNLQCASAPVLLEDEIRYYYMGTTMRHQRHWELEPQRAGLGLATIKPDRFVGLHAGEAPASLLTTSALLPSADIRVNAATTPGGWVRVELLDIDAQPIPGYTLDDCAPITGDGTALPVRWRGAGQVTPPIGQPLRLRVQAQRARLYALTALAHGG